MRSDIVILTKTFISEEKLVVAFKEIAAKINLEVEKDNANENKFAFWKEGRQLEDMRSFHLILNDEKGFIKEKDYYISNYSMRFFLTHYHEEDLIGEFIKELFEYYPDLLVCNDEIPTDGFYLFEKGHFDAHIGKNYHELLYSSPKDLGN